MKKLILLLLLCGLAAGQSKINLETEGKLTSQTKGDLLCTVDGTTLSKLTVGTNLWVLTADSTQSCGFKWAAVSSSAVPNPGANGIVQCTGTACSTSGVIAASGAKCYP